MRSAFPFNDLHSFKDFIGFVRLCAPDMFPFREGVHASEQWSLDLAFEGLSAGLNMAREQAAHASVVTECKVLFDLAFTHYRAGDIQEGSKAMEKARRVFDKIRTE